MNLKIIIPITIILLAQLALAESGLQCSTRQQDCVSGETEIFRYDGLNAGGMHAELPGQTYTNRVCCTIRWGAVPITNTCDKPYNTTIIRLASATDAHAELPNETNYVNKICIGTDLQSAQVSCTYSGECIGTQTCLASISINESESNTDLHIANCSTDLSQAYANKICCSSGDSTANTIVNGTITNTGGKKLSSAKISFHYTYDLKELAATTTDANGFYSINLTKYVANPSTYLDSIIQYAGYMPNVKEDNKVLFDETTKIDFTIVEGKGCQPDCTMESDYWHKCNPECDGINGCSFNSESKLACTIPRQVKGARKVIKDEGMNQTVIYCCSSSPVVEDKNATSINCLGKDIVKMSKIVIIDGEPVKMNVVACSNKNQ